jgi:two-component system nitrogen regulation sensor histidine kinase NtrY
VAPPASAYGRALGRAIVDTSKEEQLFRALLKLDAYEELYLYAVDRGDPAVFTRLIEAEQSVLSYREAQDNRERIQAVFALSYIETALLVLVGAAWVGISAARGISAPVGRLVQAADRVAGGDLNARVDTRGDPEEIAVLTRAFNRMTGDLQAQQSALREAREEAESERRFIETVLSRVSAGVVSVNELDKVSAANRQALLLLEAGWPAANGLPLDVVAPELAGVAARARETGGDAEEDVDLVRDGETRRLRARASIADDGGLVLTFDDITRLIAAQRNAAWRDVARRIAHEIKNPLTPIQLSAERLRRRFRREITGDLEIFDRCTDTIIRQVGDIGRMVDEFSSFARMPAPRFAPEDAGELLREAVFARRVASPDIEVGMEAVDGPVTVTCDGRLIAQALANVLKNAGEAVAARVTAEPEHRGRVLARLRLDGSEAVFEVEDNGVGLPTRDRSRLTEPYVTTREKGTGLGLAIVKRVLEGSRGPGCSWATALIGRRQGQLVLPGRRLPGVGSSRPGRRRHETARERTTCWWSTTRVRHPRPRGGILGGRGLPGAPRRPTPTRPWLRSGPRNPPWWCWTSGCKGGGLDGLELLQVLKTWDADLPVCDDLGPRHDRNGGQRRSSTAPTTSREAVQVRPPDPDDRPALGIHAAEAENRGCETRSGSLGLIGAPRRPSSCGRLIAKVAPRTAAC